jgi:hypothetical protein
VKSLALDSLTLVSLRPGPPPATNSDQMRKETEGFINSSQIPQEIIQRSFIFGLMALEPHAPWDAIAAEDLLRRITVK